MSPTDPLPRLARRQRRASDYVRQAARIGLPRPADKSVVFILGSQRSGTSLLVECFDRSPQVWTYPEGTNLALRAYRLRGERGVRRAIRLAPATCVVLKPLTESQWADRLLDSYQNARVVWTYRAYADVARSAVARWGDHQLDVVRAIRDGATASLGWHGERIPAAVLEEVRAVTPRTPEDGAVLKWYLRNSYLFDLGLDRDQRCLALDYDELAVHPTDVLARTFAFAGVPFDASAMPPIRAPVDRGGERVPIDPAIRAMADRLTRRLDDLGGRT